MRVAICDEERESSSLLVCLIQQQEPECEVVCFHSSRQFLESGQHFDILLLDIQMEEMRGIEVARAIRMKDDNTILIFVTALKEYVPEAFDVSAFHYLLKPIVPEKFCKVFENACKEVHRLKSSEKEQLFFRTKTKSFTLQKKDILYVESRKRKVDIHTSGEAHTVYATMQSMEERLGEDFYRCHRGYLVNLAYVSEYGEGTIRLQNGEAIYVAREKYSEFVKVYTQYRARTGNAKTVDHGRQT